MKDLFGRRLDYLRVSVTDRCNLRCIYCMPGKGVRHAPWKDILSYEEIAGIVRAAARLGVSKVRLTGGEPLTRKDIHLLIRSLRAVTGINEIGLTTNGIALKRAAPALASAGLTRVNVSLDSLRPDRYRAITRGGDIQAVREGIQEAGKAGLMPVKINMIPIRGINDDEIEDFARLTRYAPYHVRFIEFMPIAPERFWAAGRFVRTREVRERVSSLGLLDPVPEEGPGPARYYRFRGAPGKIGFISPLTDHFCGSCNRLRLTSDGRLRPCLFSEAEIDLKAAMRAGAGDDEIAELILEGVQIKPRRHPLGEGRGYVPAKAMSSIGG